MTRALRIEFLEQSIKEYSQLLEIFEADRVRLIRQAADAGDSGPSRLAETLAENQRGLELIHRALTRVRAQLENERSLPE